MNKITNKEREICSNMVDEMIKIKDSDVSKMSVEWCKKTQGYLVHVTKKINNVEETYIVGIER